MKLNLRQGPCEALVLTKVASIALSMGISYFSSLENSGFHCSSNNCMGGNLDCQVRIRVNAAGCDHVKLIFLHNLPYLTWIISLINKNDVL